MMYKFTEIYPCFKDMYIGRDLKIEDTVLASISQCTLFN